MAVLGFALCAPAGASHAAEPRVSSDPGFVVVAPDRGFLGNEELRDSFDAFAAGRNAALVFVTDERTRATVDAALTALRAGGARRVIVLPFFLSRSDPRFRRAEALLESAAKTQPVTWARPYGESYFAVEALADRLREVSEPAGRRLLVVGAGAADAESRQRMSADWQRLADRASAGLDFESTRVVLESSNSGVKQAIAAASAEGPRTVVVPFHLGSKMDGMMSFTSFVKSVARGLECMEGDVTPSPTVGLWLVREANRFTPLGRGDVGVVVLAHGADYHWNETMRLAVAPLAERYLVEPAFSMADPVVIGRAVRRLEARGARAIVVLRVFALAASFRDDVERLIGHDVEGPQAETAAAHHAADHSGHGGGAPAARLRSAAVLTTTGGMEDHRFFAEALLDRAKELSRDPSRETVILVAHGDGDDARDAHWRRLLDSLAATMRASGGGKFRAIQSATWREDWPDKRAPAVEQIRGLVQRASQDGGRAIVVPARILGRGPERRLLEGLAFELGEGFAPHPLFSRWAEEELAKAVEALSAGGTAISEGSDASARSAVAAASAMHALRATPR